MNPAEWYKGIAGWVDDSPSDKTAETDKSGDFPKIVDDKRPTTSTNRERDDLTKGLAADRAHAKYTEESLRREGNPTRPLLPEGGAAPAVSSPVLTRNAQPPVAAPAGAPVIDPAATDLPTAPPPAPAAAPQPKAPAADSAASVPAKAPVASADAAAPPPPPPLRPQVKTPDKPAADVTAAVPAKTAVAVDNTPAPPPAPAPAPSRLSAGGVFAGAQPAPQAEPAPQQAAQPAAQPPAPQTAAAQPAKPTGTVDDVYRRRLAQSAPDQSMPALTAQAATPADQSKGVAVIPPSDYRGKVSHDNGGALPLDNFVEGKSGSSFQVGSVNFGEGTSALAPSEQKLLKDVVALYKDKGGVIRVIGHSASPRLDVDAEANRVANRQLAGDRAAAVARELIRLGVPAKRIYAGSTGEEGAPAQSTEIYIDY